MAFNRFARIKVQDVKTIERVDTLAKALGLEKEAITIMAIDRLWEESQEKLKAYFELLGVNTAFFQNPVSEPSAAATAE